VQENKVEIEICCPPLYSYVVLMSDIPLPTILIAIAMFSLSVLIVSKLGARIPLTRATRMLILVAGTLSLVAGLYLHLSEKPGNRQAIPRVHKQEKRAADTFTFTFAPREARWGQQVDIQVPFPAESVTVYLNGMPLPKKVSGDGRTVTVTIPTATKSGYIEIEHDGTRVRGKEQILIAP
jgi:hypothetical protein